MILEKKEYKKAIWFSLLKYVEIGISALTIFYVAKKIGPIEMGKSIATLLYITYANYLSLGLNQVIVKNYSRIGKDKIKNFITINIQYLLLVSLLNFGLAYIFLGLEYFMVVAVVSSGTLIRSFFSSYFRAIFRIEILNKNSLLFSILLLVFVISFVNTWYEYMFYWAIAMWLSIVLYILDDKLFFIKIFKRLLYVPEKAQVLYNFYEGVKLATTGIIITILLTADRFVINKLDFSLSIKGSYQLAEYVSMAIYMIITTIIFYFYPKWIERIRNCNNFRKKYLKYLIISFFVAPFLLGIIYLVGILFSTLVFNEYIGLSNLVLFTSMLKLSVILLSSCSLFYIGLDKEFKYIKSMIPLIIISILLIILFLYFYNPPIYIIPLSFSLLIIVEFLRRIKHISSEINMINIDKH